MNAFNSFFLLILIISGLHIPSFGQETNVSGNWIGITTLRDEKVCPYEIKIIQYGMDLEGIIKLSTFNKQYYAIYKVKGRMFDSKIFLEGYEYIENISGGGYNWCMASLNLTYLQKNNKDYLIGSWGANSISGGCPSGSGDVEIKRENTKKQIKIDKIANRKVIVKDTINVENVIVVIDVWDNGLEDGDIISINLNNEWVLKNHQVTHKKETINFALENDNNYLTLYAENLGDIPPNTAAIEIKDGKKSKTIVLNSDEGKSEAILLTKDKEKLP
ncbi:hypothetical protein [Zobellia nedashkovskayae]|uniref:hypothetical protein n=1 Tax=Zobellia nedashkovskayae TaxID=2779510 RepID=UPI00188D186E|nr:hypothetical protein [Zobellia nedashkovskayae]